MLETLTDPATKVQFAGHDTFPLRLLWLKKAYDAVRDGADKGLFQRPDAIARWPEYGLRHQALGGRRPND